MPRIYKRNCNNCGKYYESSAKNYCSIKCVGESKVGKKHTPESILKMKEAQKGEKNHMWGKKIPKDQCKKYGHPEESHHLWGKHHSINAKNKISKIRIFNGTAKGDKNPNWKGGITNDINKYYRKDYAKKYNTNINYKLRILLRNRLKCALKHNFKSGSAVKDLGCTILEFKKYIEKLFQPGMTWDNWSFYNWHLDHIRPLALFNLSDRKQFLKACHYTNLQPLWAKDNWSKYKKALC